MNILHLYKDYHPVLGGIENYIKALAEAQAAAGHQVTVLVCDPGPKTRTEVMNGVNVIKAGRLFTAASMPLSLSQPLQLLRQRPDIVHLHAPYPLGEFSNWLLGRAKAAVITYHSDIVRPSQQKWLRLYGPILRRVLRRVDRVIPTSPPYIDSSPWLRPVRDKCTPIPIGIDVDRFKPDRPLNRRSDSVFHLLCVGLLRYYKGLDTLIEALPYIPDTHLTIVGSGPMEGEWQALAASRNLADRITFAGAVSDDELPAYYHQADLFVLPANARSEAFGMVLVEAMAAGRPCVTTELGTGTSWIVQHGQTGLVVPPMNPPALAEAINTLRTNEALRYRFAQASLARARAEFAHPVMVNRMMQIYEQVSGHLT
jgi:rhamnosyl/mannosyltransferase